MAIARRETPAGFRDDESSGLLVPKTDLPVVLKHEVITAAQWKLVSRAVKDVCAPHNIRFAWMCNDAACMQHRVCPECGISHSSIMKRTRTPNGFTLSCSHRKITYNPDL